MWIRNIEDYILYEDKEIIVCHKPAGIAVQNARVGAMDMESALKNYLAAGASGQARASAPYLGIVHRLDQPVEGVVVFAKTPRAAKELSRQMAANEMDKHYLAVTQGQPKEPQGILEDYLKKDGRTNTSAVVSAGTTGAKKARLEYKVLAEADLQSREQGKGSSLGAFVQPQTQGGQGPLQYLVQIQLETGRHHQIRVQMSNAGMPLVGDRKYNPGGNDGVSLGLCSCSLEFLHPVTKKKMKFSVTPKGAAFDGFRGVLGETKE